MSCCSTYGSAGSTVSDTPLASGAWLPWQRQTSHGLQPASPSHSSPLPGSKRWSPQNESVARNGVRGAFFALGNPETTPQAASTVPVTLTLPLMTGQQSTVAPSFAPPFFAV